MLILLHYHQESRTILKRLKTINKNIITEYKKIQLATPEDFVSPIGGEEATPYVDGVVLNMKYTLMLSNCLDLLKYGNYIFSDDDFIFACINSDVSIVKYIVETGMVDTHVNNESGFKIAIQLAKYDMVMYLWDVSPFDLNDDDELIISVCRSGDLNIVKYIFDLILKDASNMFSIKELNEHFIEACNNDHVITARFLYDFVKEHHLGVIDLKSKFLMDIHLSKKVREYLSTFKI